MSALAVAISEVARKYGEYLRCGQAVPVWLQKQSDAVQLLEADYERGKAMLIDGMQDEIEYMDSICQTN